MYIYIYSVGAYMDSDTHGIDVSLNTMSTKIMLYEKK